MTENTNKKIPSHSIYKVVGDGPQGDWTKIGVAFPHKDGKGIALVLDAIPTDGRIALRTIPPKEAQPKAQVELTFPASRPAIQLPDPRRFMR